MPNPDLLGPTSLAITQGVSAFMAFLPKLSDVRKSNLTDVDMVGDVRLGEIAATTLCVGMGTIVSSLTGSSIPTFIAVLVSAILVCIYEGALRTSGIPGRFSTEVRATDA